MLVNGRFCLRFADGDAWDVEIVASEAPPGGDRPPVASRLRLSALDDIDRQPA